MFEVTVGSDEYKVVFEYDNKLVPILPDVSKRRDVVVAHIMVLDKFATDVAQKETPGKKVWQRQFSGTAIRNPQDQSVKNTGRKIALARALKMSGFNKGTRIVFWDHYKNTRGKLD